MFGARADRTSVRYRSRRPGDAEVKARLRELASVRRRFGYRRLWVLLRRTWVQVTRYGGRVRIVELTLERIAAALVDNLKQLLGVIPVFQVKAVLQP